jgi:prepilin-type N-terminal cleavage/methylation domain-containing protein
MHERCRALGVPRIPKYLADWQHASLLAAVPMATRISFVIPSGTPTVLEHSLFSTPTMKITAASSANRSGFTLIELLTVIGIIAVLMTLLFPAVNAVKENARRMEAKNMCMQIVTAVKQYYQEYGKFPPVEENPVAGTVTADIVVGETAMGAVKASNNALFNTLRAINKTPNLDDKYNRRKVIFFESKAVASAAGGKPRGGFYDHVDGGGTPPAEQDGALYDPWGHQYGVIMDSNYDNRIDLIGFYRDFSGADATTGAAPRQTVGAFAMGKDEKLGTKGDNNYKKGTEVSDDVVSWQ